MRFFCDQNITLETVDFLRGVGHDVVGTRDVGLAEALDDEVLACSASLILNNGWLNVPGQSVFWGTGGTLSFNDGYSTSGRFYRIQAQRPQ